MNTQYKHFLQINEAKTKTRYKMDKTSINRLLIARQVNPALHCVKMNSRSFRLSKMQIKSPVTAFFHLSDWQRLKNIVDRSMGNGLSYFSRTNINWNSLCEGPSDSFQNYRRTYPLTQQFTPQLCLTDESCG